MLQLFPLFLTRRKISSCTCRPTCHSSYTLQFYIVYKCSKILLIKHLEEELTRVWLLLRLFIFLRCCQQANLETDWWYNWLLEWPNPSINTSQRERRTHKDSQELDQQVTRWCFKYFLIIYQVDMIKGKDFLYVFQLIVPFLCFLWVKFTLLSKLGLSNLKHGMFFTLMEMSHSNNDPSHESQWLIGI